MGTLAKDAKIPENAPKTLLLDNHIKYIKSFQENKDYTYIMTEYLRMSGLYWSLTAMSMMDALDEMDRAEILVFVDACFDPATGGFGASENHDPHLLYTLSAIQILLLYDELDRLDRDKVASFISNLEQPDGSFFGDKWGEVDSRFSFCAIASLKLIDRLDSIDLDAALNFILRCMNFDGGFGCTPGSETHAGQVYCCVSALSIADALHHVDADTLGWWLCERQLPMSGGLNGRPEKLPDVCYSWWVLASLAVLDRLHWIDKEKLCSFILASQDDEAGGMADRPGDLPDPFHTLFGLAGLSLLDYSDDVISKVDPVFCLPKHVLDKHGIRTQTLS